MLFFNNTNCMLSILALAGATIIGVTLVAVFWNSIKDWILRAAKKVQEIISGIVYGAKVLIRKLQDGFKEISKHYSKNGTVWEETIVTRTVSESEVPDEIKAKASMYEDTDITHEMELEIA